MGDLDNDGDLDAVIASFDDTGTAIWLNDAFGNFSAPPTTPIIASGLSSDVVLGDLDGDGDLDAVLFNVDFQTLLSNTVWLNDGTGSLSAHPTAPTVGSAPSYSAVFGDVDGDGDLDAILDDGVWRNDGSGTFSVHPMTASLGVATALGDLDGDGDLDAVGAGAAPTVSGSIAIRLESQSTRFRD